MSSANDSDTGASDPQVCNMYVASDLHVVTGVNAGDGVTSASQSFVGDTYTFLQNAQAHDLVVHDGAQNTPAETPSAGMFGDDQNETASHDGGVLGDGKGLDSRLTFMGSDGSKTEVLIIQDTSDSDDGFAGEYFLPLSPLVPDMEYTLINADIDPGEFHYSDYACVCFARGTMIQLANGAEKLIQDLVEGDSVLTRDNGAQEVRWVGGRMAPAYGHLAPIVITNGALGNHADLIVSPQHRMLLSDWRAEVMLGSHEVLVKAQDLLNGDTIYRREGGVVEYFHILFDNHEIIYAEGIPSESLHINKTTLDSLAIESRAEIIELFPQIESHPQVSAVASRMSLKSYEASALLKQVGFR